MPLVLDTFNILHTVGVLPPDLAGLDVPGLAGLIARSRYRGEKTTFVCDSLPTADLPPAGPLALREDEGEAAAALFTVRYSGRSASADDLIRDMVNASTAPRRLIVVSSDHAILRHAQRRRCTTLTAPDFLQHLADDANLPRPAAAPPRAVPPSMSDDQVSRWIDVFELDDEDLRIAAAAPIPQPPAPSQPRATEDSSSPASPDSPDSPADDDEAAGIANIDMNAILPSDSRTHPLKRRSNRAPRTSPPLKPSPPPSPPPSPRDSA